MRILTPLHVRVLTITLACALLAASPAKPLFTFEPQMRVPFAAQRAANTSAPRLFFTASGGLFLLASVSEGGKNTLAVFTSHDRGASFNKRIDVTSPGADVMTHGEMSPLIARDANTATMYVLWQSGSQLYIAHASMFGNAFSAPVELIRNPSGSSAGFAALEVAPDGTVVVAWLDHRDGDNKRGTTSVYVALSKDRGTTFTQEHRIGTSACPCCRPSMTFDDSGNVYASWRSVFAKNERDFVVARGNVETLEFSQPVRVHEDKWSIEGCPDSGAALAWINDRLWISWFTLGSEGRPQLRLASSSGSGAFSKPVVISHGLVSANHPRFVFGAYKPTVVFEGERPAPSGAWNPPQVFVATLDTQGVMLQSVGSIVSPMIHGISAGMPDAQTLIVAAGTMGKDGRSRIVIARGRSRM